MNKARFSPSRPHRLAAGALLASAALVACGHGGTRPPTTTATTTTTSATTTTAPTVDEARAFYTEVNAELKRQLVAHDLMSFVQETYINDDTDRLQSQAEEKLMGYLQTTIARSKRFDGVDLPPDLARYRKLLKLAAPVPSPTDPARRAELASDLTAMTSAYGKGKYCPPRLGGKCLDLDALSKVMRSSHKYDELTDAWVGWHAIAPPLREKYQRYVDLGNEGAKAIGFADLGEYWRSGYDMSPQDFEADVERLWKQVKPLYDDLHCYVRGKLQKTYGKDKVPDHGAVPAQLFGNMWAQEWNNIYPLVEPYAGQGSLDVTSRMKAKKYDEVGVVKLAEKFFTSLGMDPLPQTFWTRSLIKKPRDRDVVCHASAWDPSYDDDLRIKMCVNVDEETLITAHHELGHDYYFHYYHTLPVLFQAGANDGFHEGIGDTLALSVTPGYLKEAGLLETVPGNDKAAINQQMKMALEKVAFLPFGLLIDKWRWGVFSGRIAPGDYNKSWWQLRHDYQGVAPPVARSEQDFDPGAKFHVPANTPYMRYFLARIYQFQFHRALCKAAGYQGPLSACSIYGNKEAGAKLTAMLRLGASRPWPDALEALSGERQADATALLEYFAPLAAWLKEQNKGQTCGWE